MFSSWVSTLFVVMEESRRNNLPNNPFLSSWQTQWLGVRELCWNNFGINDGAKESRIIPEF